MDSALQLFRWFIFGAELLFSLLLKVCDLSFALTRTAFICGSDKVEQFITGTQPVLKAIKVWFISPLIFFSVANLRGRLALLCLFTE